MKIVHHNVKWDDLIKYKSWEIVKELLLPLPWLVISLAAYYHGYYLIALFCTFYFFLTSLRLSHNAFHYALGLPKHITDIIMLLQSGLMLGSLHAIQYTHIRHHAHYLSNEDIEGRVAKHGFWEVIVKSPLFPLLIHHCAWTHAQRKSLPWIYAELGLNAAVIFGVFFVFDIFALKWHVTLMIIGHCLSAFFAVWSVHRGCNSPDFPARTLRGKIKNLLFYNMFFHFEHHLFPQVPTCHLPILAQRIDKAGIKNYELVF